MARGIKVKVQDVPLKIKLSNSIAIFNKTLDETPVLSGEFKAILIQQAMRIVEAAYHAGEDNVKKRSKKPISNTFTHYKIACKRCNHFMDIYSNGLVTTTQEGIICD